MTLKLITPPTEEPVEVEELKLHTRIDGFDSDGDLLLKLAASRSYIEETELRGRTLVTSTYDLFLPAWPCSGFIEIPRGNLQSVTYVKYTDSAGVLNTWASTEYKLSRTYDITSGASDSGIGRLHLAYGKSWPSASLDVGEPIVIRFVCGWKDAASVPSQLKSAIELYADHLFENRSAVTIGNSVAPDAAHSAPLAMAIESLCSPYMDRR